MTVLVKRAKSLDLEAGAASIFYRVRYSFMQ